MMLVSAGVHIICGTFYSLYSVVSTTYRTTHHRCAIRARTVRYMKVQKKQKIVFQGFQDFLGKYRKFSGKSLCGPRFAPSFVDDRSLIELYNINIKNQICCSLVSLKPERAASMAFSLTAPFSFWSLKGSYFC